MGTDEERLEAAKKVLDEAIKAYVSVGREQDSPYVTGWALAYEFTSVELEQDDSTADNVAVMDGQLRAASRGLFDFGVDHFTRVRAVS